jgi:shikimate dehydrogenase
MRKIKLYGIIGCPVSHSLSPYMHNAAFNRLGIDAVYLPFEVEKKNLKNTIAALRKSNITGFNVTIPFKSECIKYLDNIDAAARNIGAVNTVVSKNKKLIGYNTDCEGFIKSLKADLKFNPRGKKTLILGAGGAARAVVFALAKEGSSAIYIYDIINKKAEILARDIKNIFAKKNVKPCAKNKIGEIIRGCNLIVNCTPLGMKKQDPMPLDLNLLHKGLLLYDIVYTPLETKLIKAARKKGIRAIGGIGMLLYQGVLAFELWTNKKAPVSLMKKELLKKLLNR